MILTCPFCKTRYLIAATVFAAGPRQVRCARCSHGWQAELPKEIDAIAPPPDLTPTPDTPLPIPPGSNLPVVIKQPLSPGTLHLIWAGIIAALCMLSLLWLVLDRRTIVERWPGMADFYDAIGLHIYYYGEGLELVKVRSELVYDSGIMRLVVEGGIRNGTAKVQEIPDIAATAIGPDGNSIQSWQIDAPAIRVFPGETMPFHSAINAPKGTVTDVNLRFIEMKHDSR